MSFFKKKNQSSKMQKKKINVSVPDLKPKPEIRPVPSPSKRKSESAKKYEDRYPEKEFMKTFSQLTHRHRAWDIWRDFVTMFACSISNAVDKDHYDDREERYMKIIKKYDEEERNMFPELAAHTIMALEKNQEQDFLGSIFMALNLGNHSGGQFFTLYHVCELMARMTINYDTVQQVKEKGYITINDPCCGAGATLISGIHAARRQLEKENMNFQNHVLVVAQDIDEIVAMMCYIQLSLLGVAAYIKVGNTFTEPMGPNDSLGNYWFTPMYFSDIWVMRRKVHKVGESMKGER